MWNKILALSFVVSATFLISCEDDNNDITVPEINSILGALPASVVYPENNPYSEEKAALGKMLFWDPILSGNKDVACASCHHPDFAYADGLDLSFGVDGVGLGPDRTDGLRTIRNSPTILNTAYNGFTLGDQYDPENAPMFWDSRTNSLEEQAREPLLSKEEMRGSNIPEDEIIDTIIQRLKSLDNYTQMFEEVFGDEAITEDKIFKAIATFERTLISNNSRFDRFINGETNILSNQELEGMRSFISSGCADCHSGPMFSDFELRTLGVREINSTVDEGANESFEFRTPTLRNIELTAPYMHNGIFETLEDVLDFYDDITDGDEEDIHHLLDSRDIDRDARELDVENTDAIIDFLKTLTDENFDKGIPSEVPSGLSPGGKID